MQNRGSGTESASAGSERPAVVVQGSKESEREREESSPELRSGEKVSQRDKDAYENMGVSSRKADEAAAQRAEEAPKGEDLKRAGQEQADKESKHAGSVLEKALAMATGDNDVQFEDEETSAIPLALGHVPEQHRAAVGQFMQHAVGRQEGTAARFSDVNVVAGLIHAQKRAK